MEARKRVLAKIAEDKAERARKAAGGSASEAPAQAAPPPQASAAAAPPKPAVDHNEANLRFRTPTMGVLQQKFPAETTLGEVAQFLQANHGVVVNTFATTFPNRTFGASDMEMTLKEAGLVPNAVVIVK